jgi:hypothetical protein
MEADKLYTKGFNDGFLLAEHAPALVQKLTPSLTPTNDYLDGLLAGTQEFTLEQEKQQLRELARLRDNGFEERHFDRE